VSRAGKAAEPSLSARERLLLLCVASVDPVGAHGGITGEVMNATGVARSNLATPTGTYIVSPAFVEKQPRFRGAKEIRTGGA